jgi:hypothetical protein
MNWSSIQAKDGNIYICSFDQRGITYYKINAYKITPTCCECDRKTNRKHFIDKKIQLLRQFNCWTDQEIKSIHKQTDDLNSSNEFDVPYSWRYTKVRGSFNEHATNDRTSYIHLVNLGCFLDWSIKFQTGAVTHYSETLQWIHYTCANQLQLFYNHKTLAKWACVTCDPPHTCWTLHRSVYMLN